MLLNYICICKLYILWNTSENIYWTSVYILLFYLLFAYCYQNLSLYIFIIIINNAIPYKHANCAS